VNEIIDLCDFNFSCDSTGGIKMWPVVFKNLTMQITENITLTNEDCMDLLSRTPDKFYELAIVDPPYGIGANKMTLGNGKIKIYRGVKDWDKSIPNNEYFDELFRVSKNQVIWGANYMTQYLRPTSSWLFWDKCNGDNDFSDGELAWTSFGGALRKITKSWVGNNAKDGFERIHPTQKPVALYKWLLHNYAKEGDKILDTHLGSGSIAIACHDYKFKLTACELDKEYYDKAVRRVKDHVAQLTLF
jgi:site-specific DNA-methyltransferase (adenine-specific)